MSPIERDRSLRVRVSSDELDMAHELADRDGVSASDVVRLLIRREYRKAFGDKKPRNR